LIKKLEKWPKNLNINPTTQKVTYNFKIDLNREAHQVHNGVQNGVFHDFLF